MSVTVMSTGWTQSISERWKGRDGMGREGLHLEHLDLGSGLLEPGLSYTQIAMISAILHELVGDQVERLTWTASAS
jgi:hypothetical protein